MIHLLIQLPQGAEITPLHPEVQSLHPHIFAPLHLDAVTAPFQDYKYWSIAQSTNQPTHPLTHSITTQPIKYT